MGYLFWYITSWILFIFGFKYTAKELDMTFDEKQYLFKACSIELVCPIVRELFLGVLIFQEALRRFNKSSLAEKFFNWLLK